MRVPQEKLLLLQALASQSDFNLMWATSYS